MKNADHFLHEGDYADFSVAAATEHLRQAIRFDTTSYVDNARIRYDQFDALHAYLAESYPLLMERARVEKVGHSLLITLPGSDQTFKPALFMAHQDVVPLVKGTEGDWLHGPFSGDLADGFIWGRGAMDIKQMLIAELESVEYWLKKGASFRRTVCLAFGEDEETLSTGARALSALLRQRNVKLEYVLDEGSGDVMDAGDLCAPGTTICTVGMYEKGYADMRLRARSRGGHSSNPFYGTSLGTLARAIAAIVEHPPAPKLSQTVLYGLKALSPWITEAPLSEWVQDIPQHEQDILSWYLSKESLYHQVQTTVAPTMISGGSQAGNVMPQDMEAVINFRLCPQDTPESLLAYCQELAGNDVKCDYAQQISASVPSDLNAPGFTWLKKVLGRYFGGFIFLPVQNKGATDARYYEPLSRCVMRFGPFLEEEDISAQGIHGTNERISVRAFAQGIRVLIRLMEETCINLLE